MSYAEVAVNSPGAGRRTFCYAVPSNMHLSVGHAVWVPFGPRVLQGVVIETTEQPSVDETREVAGLIAPDPILYPHQARLARWISEYYLSPLFDVVALMLPPGFSRRMLTFIDLMPYPTDSAVAKLNHPQRAVLDLVGEEGRVDIREVEKALGKREAKEVIDQLVRKKLIKKTQQLERGKVKPKTVSYIRLTVEATQELVRLLKARGAPKQAQLLRMLEAGPITVSEARKRLGSTSAVVSALERKGLVSIDKVQVYRDPLEHRTFTASSAPDLTLRQEAAWREIKAAIRLRHSLSERYPASPPEAKVFLLHGVAGSGKTEIYLRALEEAVSVGRRAIVLVPEIALTPQTIDRFASRFPGRVAVLHSKLSMGEQFDEWRRIREGAFDVVIGSRGAVFAPQPDLGLVVIDEEHEWTYKQQEQAPRYHARDVAIKLAEFSGAVVVLGSATPDVTTYHKAQKGEYRLLELPQRIGTGEKELEVVDLRDELKAGNRSIFSRPLAKGVKKALAAGEQVILFLNRRGSAAFVQCRDCGYVPRCKRCDVALTYHSTNERLACHQCNHRVAVPRACPRCGSKRIKFLGIGTQKVEEEARHTFPDAELLRWDRDATGGKRSHEEILERFISHKADILIGTQMIAKGLDIPLVTLVGIVNADVSLHLPDFRAGERTYQILSQVAGRAGRSSLPGRVILQSYTPEHYAIDCVSNHDYRYFYEQEISLRREYDNPPFSRLARLLYMNPNNTICQRETRRMSRVLKEERDSWGMEIDLIGPAPSFFPRVRGRYRWQIILRGAELHGLLDRIPLPRGWIVDMDPVSLL